MRRPATLPLASAGPLGARVYDLEVASDALPDTSDMESTIRSMTASWETPAEKCWAVFFWLHIARRHCRNATGPDGFLTGPDCERSLADEARCFDPRGLEHRYYVLDWDRGHRYIPNLRPGEEYTRYYHALGNEPQCYVPNPGRDPEVTEHGAHRFRIRGNGVWTFAPRLTADGLASAVHALSGLRPLAPQGLAPARPAVAGRAVFKIDGANVIASLRIRAGFHRASPADLGRISISTTNGLAWREVWRDEGTGPARIDSPHEIVRVVYGGRLYNRAPKAQIDFPHFFDGGRTWTKSDSLAETKPPWDAIHYETVSDVPPGTRSVLFKYLWEASEACPSAASIHAVRMGANARAPARFEPIDVTFTWDEVGPDRSRIERSHTERAARIPHRYAICVGGADHPIVKSLRLSFATPDAKLGYSDGRDAGLEPFVPRWVAYGENLVLGKPYTVSIASAGHWGAGDPDGRKLTDGIVGPPYGSGAVARHGLCWTEGQEPIVTVDLGSPRRAGAFRIQLSGSPDWDALKGEIRDRVEVGTSLDGERYASHGAFDLPLRWKDLPVNHMWPDDERIAGRHFEKILPAPVDLRYARFRIRAARFLFASEVQVLDRIEYRPFDLRNALP